MHNNNNTKEHWENIYSTKSFSELSWFQDIPDLSISLFKELNLPLTAKIIDVGAGESYFVDYLLETGYSDITILDISETAIHKTKKRLGDRSDKVKWIIADITQFESTEQFDFWHDRALFHFLINIRDMENYIEISQRAISSKGFLVIGTFSLNGPLYCSGLETKQYSEKSITECMAPYFEKLRCIEIDHHTPFNTIQHFIFCCFKRKIG